MRRRAIPTRANAQSCVFRGAGGLGLCLSITHYAPTMRRQSPRDQAQIEPKATAPPHTPALAEAELGLGGSYCKGVRGINAATQKQKAAIR